MCGTLSVDVVTVDTRLGRLTLSGTGLEVAEGLRGLPQGIAGFVSAAERACVAQLQHPSQSHLSCSLAANVGDGVDRRVMQQRAFAMSERSIGLHARPVGERRAEEPRRVGAGHAGVEVELIHVGSHPRCSCDAAEACSTICA